jgi:transcriptional regulator with XRE-family HTH domain
MSTGKRIRACRNAAGLTQKQLAEAVGLTESAVRNYELDIRTPKDDQISAMAKTMKVSPASLANLKVESAREALEVLFRLEDSMGFYPEETDDGMCVGVDHHAKSAPKIQAALEVWKTMRDDLQAGKITQAEYDIWKASFGA